MVLYVRVVLGTLKRQREGQTEPTDPYAVIRLTIGYLENNQNRMDYPRYRQAGLPITRGQPQVPLPASRYRAPCADRSLQSRTECRGCSLRPPRRQGVAASIKQRASTQTGLLGLSQ